jgi:glycosyltransferase involved in cell wall biosynthesis
MALESITKQTVLPSEFILVVDGQVGVSIEKVINQAQHKFESNFIDFIVCRLDENMGHAIARQTGIDLCKYNFVAICDADDISHSFRFEKLINAMMMDTEPAVVGSHVQEKNLFDSASQMTVRKVPLSTDSIYAYSKYRCPFNQMTVMLRKSDINSVGGYKHFYHNEDYYLWFRLIKNGFTMANLDEILVTAHQDAQSFNRRGGIKYFLSEMRIKKLYLQAGMLSSLEFIGQVIIRIFVQLCMPSLVRRYLFLKFLRSS